MRLRTHQAHSILYIRISNDGDHVNHYFLMKTPANLRAFCVPVYCIRVLRLFPELLLHCVFRRFYIDVSQFRLFDLP